MTAPAAGRSHFACQQRAGCPRTNAAQSASASRDAIQRPLNAARCHAAQSASACRHAIQRPPYAAGELNRDREGAAEREYFAGSEQSQSAHDRAPARAQSGGVTQ